MDKTGLRRTALALALILSSLLLAARPAAAQPAESRPSSVRTKFFRATTIGEVLSGWQPGVHLYVLGNVGLEDDTLAELAKWLADKHWTVLLVEDATGQTYTDVDGVPRLGEDAIEYGTGQGIPRRPGFSEQVHPRTEESDGAIFTIVLAQRSLFYTGSAAQDSRSLGEGQFKDNLDQWAIAAMRSGGDVVRAVEDTVTNIDSRLASVITQEMQVAEWRIDTARSALQAAAESLSTLDGQATDLREAHPELSGTLARPDLPKLRDELGRAESVLADDPESAARAAESIQRQALAQIRAIEVYPAMGKTLESAWADLTDLERRERAGAARGSLVAARWHLTEARELHA